VQEASLDSYCFDHALTQRTLYGEITSRRKRKLHLAAGETLERLTSEPAARGRTHGREAEMAYHFLLGDDPPRALRYSMQAGDAAEAVFAYAEAEQHYRAALELARRLRDLLCEAEVLEKLGSVLRVRGRFELALERLNAAAQAYGALDDREGEGRVVVQIGRVRHREGNAAAGLDRIDRFLQTIDCIAPTVSLAELYAVRSHLLWLIGRNGESLTDAERSAAMVRGLGRVPGADRVLSDAETQRGELLLMLGRPEEGRDVLEAALPAAERAGNLDTLSILLECLAGCHEACGDIEPALLLKRQALAIAERLGNPGETAMYSSFVCWSLLRLGRTDEVRVELERAVLAARSADPSWLTSIFSAVAGWIYLELGDWEDAIRYLESSAEIASQLRLVDTLAWANAGLAWIELFHGRPALAVGRIERALEQLDGDRLQGLWLTCTVVIAHTQLGNVGRAEPLSAQLVDLADARNLSDGPLRIHCRRAQAMVDAQCDRLDARRNLEEALSIARQMSLPWDEAVVLETYGEICAGAHDASAAGARLREALALFQELGAGPHAERVERSLAHLQGVILFPNRSGVR
jgi:tetratricopeptide (TPR) repeat protein